MLGGELQPPGGGHAGAADLADHGGKPAMVQAILHHREHLFVAATFGVEETLGAKPGQSQSGSEKVAAGKGPEDRASLAAGAGRDAGKKQGRGGIVAEMRAVAGDFVQCGGSEPAAL
jgi:hypothetical protein